MTALRPDLEGKKRTAVKEAVRAAESETRVGLEPEAEVVPNAPRITREELSRVLHDRALAEEFGPIVEFRAMVDEVVTIERVERYTLHKKPVWLLYVTRADGDKVRTTLDRERVDPVTGKVRAEGRDAEVEAVFGAAPIELRLVAFRPHRRGGPRYGFLLPGERSPMSRDEVLRRVGGVR